MRSSTIFLFLAATVLFGCATTKEPFVPEAVEPKIITKTEYILRIPPAELLTIPPQVENIDVETATQADVAEWLVKNEQRIKQLESTIKGLGEFLVEEQKKLERESD